MDVLDHLDKLKVFSVVAKNGSISSAAKELPLSQPAITRTIQTLENSVGYKLFNRDRNGMHLTKGGSIFYNVSLRVIKEICDAVHRGSHAEVEMSGDIKIGTYESLAEYLWPDFIEKVQDDYPYLNVSLKTNSKEGHLTELRTGTLDLLVDVEPRYFDGLTMWPLYKDRFNFYCNERTTLTPESSVNLTLLSVENAFDENNLTIEQHLNKFNYRFQRKHYFDSFTTVKRMATKGLGIAVLPMRLVNKADNLKIVSTKALKSGFGPHQIFVTVSPHGERDGRVKTLIKLIKKQLKK